MVDALFVERRGDISQNDYHIRQRLADPDNNVIAAAAKTRSRAIEEKVRSATRFRITIMALCVAFLYVFGAMDCPGKGIDEIDRFVRSEMARRQIPGAAIVVVKNGKIVKRANYGLANVELGVPVTSKTSFEIASMTKAFSAAAVLLLVEDGKLTSWGWSSHVVGGKYRKLQTMTGADMKTLMEQKHTFEIKKENKQNKNPSLIFFKHYCYFVFD